MGAEGRESLRLPSLSAIAAFTDGKYAQAFPGFGSERMGAPVVAFCRIDMRTKADGILKPLISVVREGRFVAGDRNHQARNLYKPYPTAPMAYGRKGEERCPVS
jgi:hypothetical protein